jgi:hypothetical protein
MLVEKILFDRKSAAQALSISIRTLDYFLAAQAFETRKIGRKVLITAGSLKKFSQANHYGAVSQTQDVAA